MNFKQIIAVLFLLFTTNACYIKGSFQGLLSYYKIVEKDSSFLPKRPVDNQICNVKYSDTSKVFILNGKQLLPCLKKSDKSIVYIWAINCKSPNCYALDRLQILTNERGVDLYVVAEYYDIKLMKNYYNINYPIIGIDTKYYKSNFTDVYLKKFKKDLGIVDKSYNRLFFMEKGIFKKSFSVIDSLL